jgi:hypothetical protein
MSKHQALARELVDALHELDGRDLWRDEAEEVPPFVIDLEGEPPILAMLSNEVFGARGLVLLRGEGALEEFEALIRREDADFDQLERTTVLQVHVGALGDVPPPLRGLSETAGIRPRREARVPFAISKPPGRDLRSATRGEMELLLQCVEGVLIADERGEFTPEAIEAQGDETLEISIRRSAPGEAEYEGEPDGEDAFSAEAESEQDGESDGDRTDGDDRPEDPKDRR